VTGDELVLLFLGIRREAFRLEQLDRYTVDEENALYSAWQAGDSIRRTPETSEWLRLISEHTAAGRRIYSVRIVDRPLSEYVRFELACLPDNVDAGQVVSVVDRHAHPDLAALTDDFWLFDDAIAAVMRYDEDGRPLEPEAAADVAAYRRRRDLTLAHARPLDEWLAAHRHELQERRRTA